MIRPKTPTEATEVSTTRETWTKDSISFDFIRCHSISLSLRGLWSLPGGILQDPRRIAHHSMPLLPLIQTAVRPLK